jgi:hypothetical protein
MAIESKKDRVGRFDQIRILTTKNITYVSAPPGTEITPDGIWSVAAIIGQNDLLCAKNNILVKVPISDVLKIGQYDLQKIFDKLGKLSHG